MIVAWFATRKCGKALSIIEQAYQKVQEFKGAEAEVFHADVPEYYLPEKERCIYQDGSTDLAFQDRHG